MAARQLPRTLSIRPLGPRSQEGKEVDHIPVPPKLGTVNYRRGLPLSLSGLFDFRVRVLGGDTEL